MVKSSSSKDTSEALDEDKVFKANLAAQCATKSKEWDARSTYLTFIHLCSSTSRISSCCSIRSISILIISNISSISSISSIG